MIPSARIFRSRWAALLWAGGIVWMAVDVAASAPHEGNSRAVPADHADTAGLNAADLDIADLERLSNTLD